MQEWAWLAEPIRVWLDGGTWDQISTTEGFRIVLMLCAVLIPPTVIALGIGMTDWRETPLAQYFGATPPEPGENSDWTLRARDLDKDGTPDI